MQTHSVEGREKDCSGNGDQYPYSVDPVDFLPRERGEERVLARIPERTFSDELFKRLCIQEKAGSAPTLQGVNQLNHFTLVHGWKLPLDEFLV